MHWKPLTLMLSLSLLAAPGPGMAQDDAAPEEDAAPTVGVERSVVCTTIEEREPVGAGEVFSADVGQLFCFTQISGAEGQTIVHAWIHEGTTRARVELSIGSDLWRTYSSKTLLPSWTGDWQVKILTEAGAVLETLDFRIGDEP